MFVVWCCYAVSAIAGAVMNFRSLGWLGALAPLSVLAVITWAAIEFRQ